ncbi:MAG: hypothetical protein AAB458_01320 [Patescibacteria group bacterium]
MPKKLGTTNGQKSKLDQLLSEAGVRSDLWQRGYDEGQLQLYIDSLAQGHQIEIAKFVPTFDPKTCIYRFEVNYDETFKEKLAVPDGTTVVNTVDDFADEKKYPNPAMGREVISARIVFRNRYTNQNDSVIEKGLHPKELVDFAKAFPRPMFDDSLPLVASGRFWTVANGDRFFLFLSRDGVERKLGYVWLSPGGGWFDGWRFLVRA